MNDYKKTISVLITITLIIHGVNSFFDNKVIPTSAVVVIILFLVALWNNFLWKLDYPKFVTTIAYVFGLRFKPCLSGKWKVTVKSSYDNRANEYEGVAEIKQNYLKLFVSTEFANSCSDSTICLMEQEQNGRWYLLYKYINRPKDSTLQNSTNGGMHEGFSYLKVINSNLLEGHYTNDENRRTVGVIKFERLEKDTINIMDIFE